MKVGASRKSPPRLYAIADAGLFPTTEGLVDFVQALATAGCTLVQYRNKSGNARIMLEHARELRKQHGASVRLIMNDRADLCLAADFDGVHVGQDDLSPDTFRRSIGAERWLGV